ncbi:hypothetical protein RUM43_010554 [Polyplax serrata]|uniref:Uncharacterized protein n=1 Tax=Polyplax serrata TaxID=468196 RepID=A0AAN8PA17_POLSC
MKTRRTVIVGTIVIASVLALILTTLFFSQDSCSEGTFLCGNSTFCIPQKSMCNGHSDCPNGDDETVTTCGNNSLAKILDAVMSLRNVEELKN